MLDFTVAVRAQNGNVSRAMRMVERGDELTLAELRAANTDGEHGGEFRGIEASGGELYQQLVLMTEPLSVSQGEVQ